MLKRVLVTGATGNIGTKIRSHLENRFSLKLLDLHGKGDPNVIEMDLSEWNDRIVDICKEIDVILHLAADPDETKSWQELIPSNLDALSNIFFAAAKNNVPRIIFASSNHVMGGYKDTEKTGNWLNSEIAPKPGTHFENLNTTPYAAMKLAGERLSKGYAMANHGVCIAIRIGWVCRIGDNRPEDLPTEAPEWYKKMWLSTDDLCQLIEKSISTPLGPQTFLIVNGMSANEDMVWNIEETKSHLGYIPKDGRRL